MSLEGVFLAVAKLLLPPSSSTGSLPIMSFNLELVRTKMDRMSSRGEAESYTGWTQTKATSSMFEYGTTPYNDIFVSASLMY